MLRACPHTARPTPDVPQAASARPRGRGEGVAPERHQGLAPAQLATGHGGARAAAACHRRRERGEDRRREQGREEGIGERDKGGSHLSVAIEGVVKVDLSRK